MAIEIVDLPTKNGDFVHSYVSLPVYQSVYPSCAMFIYLFGMRQMLSLLVTSLEAWLLLAPEVTPATSESTKWKDIHTRVCLKIVYPYTQLLMIIIPSKWL